MSYSVVYDEIWRRVASMVDEILRGRRPADSQVEELSSFHLAINRATAHCGTDGIDGVARACE